MPDILLVDDEPQILLILEESLKNTGFQVRTASGGQEGLEALRQHTPDVAVVDLRMPGINGLDLMREAKSLLPNLSMVVLTGYSDTKSAVEALRLGAYDYLTKPVDMDRLVQTLRNAVEHRRLMLENRTLVRRLQEANKIKREFINGMSHEVRTPLGHVIGFTELLQDTVTGLTEKQAGYLEKIKGAANRLLGLFDNVLQFSISRSGDAQVKPVSYPLDALVNKVAEEVRGLVAAKSMRVEASPSGLRAGLDPDVCEKILTLLMDNAVKFTPDGGLVKVACQRLASPPAAVPPTEDGEIASSWVRVAISDTGPGVKEEDRERIFEVFEQGDASLSRSFEGTGLGLALARSLARIHGGDVLLEESGPSGSTFSMVVPDLSG